MTWTSPPGLARDARDAFPAVPRHRAFVGMGGNLGDVRASLRSALAAMDESLPGTTLEAVSSLYRTRPVDADGPDYLNAVAMLRSALGPEELLRALHRLEHQHDRERPFINAPRTLDLDLLWYGDLTHHSATLTLPHPRMMQRAFVLVPLVEVLAGQRMAQTQGAASAASSLRQTADEHARLASAMPNEAAISALATEQGIEKLDGPWRA